MATSNSTINQRYCRYCQGEMKLSTTIAGENSMTCVACGHEVLLSTTEHSTLDATDVRAAQHVAAGHQVQLLPSGAALVESATTSATYAVVNGRCTCKAGQHGRACWHLSAARRAAA